MSIKENSRSRQKTADENHPEESARLERIAGHTAGLVEDLKAWFELKIEYVLLDFKDDLQAMGKQYMYEMGFQAGFVALLIVAALFALTGAAFGLGTWLGHTGWGFLAVTLVLLVCAYLVRWIGRRVAKQDGKVDSYSYRVKDAQPRLPKKEAEKETASAQSASKKMLEPKTPELTLNDHAKD